MDSDVLTKKMGSLKLGEQWSRDSRSPMVAQSSVWRRQRDRTVAAGQGRQSRRLEPPRLPLGLHLPGLWSPRGGRGLVRSWWSRQRR